MESLWRSGNFVTCSSVFRILTFAGNVSSARKKSRTEGLRSLGLDTRGNWA